MGASQLVGVAEHPVTSGLFSVESSADNINGDGQRFHESDPGEDMNFTGISIAQITLHRGRTLDTHSVLLLGIFRNS